MCFSSRGGSAGAVTAAGERNGGGGAAATAGDCGARDVSAGDDDGDGALRRVAVTSGAGCGVCAATTAAIPASATNGSDASTGRDGRSAVMATILRSRK